MTVDYIHELDYELDRQLGRIQTRRAELLRDLQSLRQNVDKAIERLEAGPDTSLDTWWIGAAEQAKRHQLTLEATYEAVGMFSWTRDNRHPATEELLKRAWSLVDAGAPIAEGLPGFDD